MRARAVSLAAPLRWLGGPIIWAAHFLLVYASESLVCTRGGGAHDHFLIVAAVSAGAVAALLAIIVGGLRAGRAARAEQGRDGGAFMEDATVALALLSLIAVLWAVLPATLVSACSPPV
jgi:hypothetical protein